LEIKFGINILKIEIFRFIHFIESCVQGTI
jgi:hypothetical protein